MNKYIYNLLCLLLMPLFCFGQGEVFQTFKDRRVINAHSTETLKKRQLDFRVSHRFGDAAGANGGWQNFYGFENASDILTGFEYGITDDLMIGISRTKGSTVFRQNINGLIKYKILAQKEGKGMPISMSVVGTSSISTMKKTPVDPQNPSLTAFEKSAHRMSYVAQVIIARKFSNRFALQINPSYSHRNLVRKEDTNGLFSIGLAGRIQLTKIHGFIFDMTYPVSDIRNPFSDSAGTKYYVPLGFGWEIDTGGHVFQINLTNSTGIMATDYIPYTQTNWLDGQFRLGFTISRLFNL